MSDFDAWWELESCMTIPASHKEAARAGWDAALAKREAVAVPPEFPEGSRGEWPEGYAAGWNDCRDAMLAASQQPALIRESRTTDQSEQPLDMVATDRKFQPVDPDGEYYRSAGDAAQQQKVKP